MKILVIGSKGMLGSDLINELNKTSYEVVGWDMAKTNITKKEDMKKINQENPDLIINCAAYTNVDGAETEADKAYAVNVEGMGNLVDFCKSEGIIFVTISTDYVFNGKEESYNEDDEKDPVNYYGKTKSKGEDLVVNNLDKYYIVRTSWLFGKNGKNFVETMIKLCAEKDEIKVVDDQKGKPTYTMDLAKAIINLIESKKPYGIYHITNEGVCSRYEFAKYIANLKSFDCRVVPCTTEEFSRPAKRPKFGVLNNNKTEKLQSWKKALKDYMELGGGFK